jgi:predicted phage gp36 major capsid-like protein
MVNWAISRLSKPTTETSPGIDFPSSFNASMRRQAAARAALRPAVTLRTISAQLVPRAVVRLAEAVQL